MLLLAPSDELRFNGFSPKTLRFLADLGANNTKSWFDAHRQDYEDYVLTPFKALVAELESPMMEIDPLNGTIGRISS